MPVTYDLTGTLDAAVTLTGGTKSAAGVSVTSVAPLQPTFKISDPRVTGSGPGPVADHPAVGQRRLLGGRVLSP
ncbi:MAG: hypothetical protein IPK75_18890 [Acidobacteria bacterium]|nr:hypothetical protein [Acidobacteriota bacterium]